MHTHPSISTNALFLLLLLLFLLLQTTAGKKIKHQPQPSATRKDVASNGGCCEEDGKGLLFQRQPRAPAVATAETCSIAGSFPRTGQNLSRGPEGRAGARSPLRTRRQPAPPRLQGLQKFSCCRGRAAKCVPEEGGERPGKEQAGWLWVIRNLVQEERSGFFLCCLL